MILNIFFWILSFPYVKLAMVIVGGMNSNSCPAEPMIPMYLIGELQQALLGFLITTFIILDLALGFISIIRQVLRIMKLGKTEKLPQTVIDRRKRLSDPGSNVIFYENFFGSPNYHYGNSHKLNTTYLKGIMSSFNYHSVEHWTERRLENAISLWNVAGGVFVFLSFGNVSHDDPEVETHCNYTTFMFALISVCFTCIGWALHLMGYIASVYVLKFLEKLFERTMGLVPNSANGTEEAGV